MSVEPSGSVRRGGCQCGAVRYESTGAQVGLYVCHCRECRRQSASAFGISVVVSQAGFRVVRGTPRTWSRPTDSGHLLDCAFCGDCGSRLWHQRRGAHATLNIKGGSLDQPPNLGEAVHIWTARRLAGVLLPDGAVQFPFEPSD
jgi:hypothetical protein